VEPQSSSSLNTGVSSPLPLRLILLLFSSSSSPSFFFFLQHFIEALIQPLETGGNLPLATAWMSLEAACC
jgi:hypothetical protein